MPFLYDLTFLVSYDWLNIMQQFNFPSVIWLNEHHETITEEEVGFKMLLYFSNAIFVWILGGMYSGQS